MRMQRKIIILTGFLLCFVLLAGCAAEQNNEQTSAASSSNSSATASAGTDGREPEALSALRNKIKDAGCAVGIAFIDYIEPELSAENTTIYLNHSETVEEYPFLSDIKTVAYKGSELFVLVPASAEGIITLFPADIDDNGEYKVNTNEVIDKGAPGEPIALRCNMSESYANVLVSVTSEDQACTFYPMISLEDGWSIALQDGCYDFSLDNIHKYIDGAYYMLSKTHPEIQEALDNGKELICVGDFYYCNQTMIRFELGQYTVNNDGYSQDGFVCEKQYAVSFDATYAMDPSDHKWYIIGAGVNGMGLKE